MHMDSQAKFGYFQYNFKVWSAANYWLDQFYWVKSEVFCCFEWLDFWFDHVILTSVCACVFVLFFVGLCRMCSVESGFIVLLSLLKTRLGVKSIKQ